MISITSFLTLPKSEICHFFTIPLKFSHSQRYLCEEIQNNVTSNLSFPILTYMDGWRSNHTINTYSFWIPQTFLQRTCKTAAVLNLFSDISHSVKNSLLFIKLASINTHEFNVSFTIFNLISIENVIYFNFSLVRRMPLVEICLSTSIMGIRLM